MGFTLCFASHSFVTSGVNYHFVSREVFEEDIAKGLFIEHAVYANNMYGTSYAAVDAVRHQGKVSRSSLSTRSDRRYFTRSLS
jgi:hypothetical protein